MNQGSGRRPRTIHVAALIVLTGLASGCPKFQQGPVRSAIPAKHFIELGERGKIFVKQMGSGPAVLLIHGYAGAVEHWAPLMPAIAHAGFRAIAVDLPGSGRSDKYPGDYSPAGLARTLLALLDRLGVQQAHVAGHSWGTSLALALALRAPARVKSVTLVGPWAYEDQLAPFIVWARAPLIGELLYTVYFDQFLDERMPLTFYEPDFWAAQPQYIALARRQLKRPGWLAAALAAARGMRFEEQQQRYRTIATPALIIQGAADPVTRMPWAKRIHADIPDSQLVVIEHARHMPQIEQPVKTLRAMLTFLQQTEARIAATAAPPRPASPPASAPAAPGATQPASRAEVLR